MSTKSWLGTAPVVGVLYCVIGIVFALPSSQVRMWRLAAWVISAVIFAAHIAYDHFRLAHRPRATALHAGLGVAVGAFGLAVAANLHELWGTPRYRPAMAVALVAWPLLTGIPAFVIALIAGFGLTVIRRRS